MSQSVALVKLRFIVGHNVWNKMWISFEISTNFDILKYNFTL